MYQVNVKLRTAEPVNMPALDEAAEERGWAHRMWTVMRATDVRSYKAVIVGERLVRIELHDLRACSLEDAVREGIDVVGWLVSAAGASGYALLAVEAIA